ncbi:MAG: hypothetical protein KAR33_10290, partial [Candidatus Thorarchaeota archaeon]|nr:hypothetical protein [Candidatus Thorarchaeota archaeon]
MTKQSSLVGIALVLLFMLPSYVASAQFNYESFHPSCREHWGPYVDKIVYNFIDDEDNQIRALIDDEIDLIDHPINSSFYDLLLEADNIIVETTPSNSYMGFVFNCVKYPFNITAFRRAFAYALDKERLAELWMDSEIRTARSLDACVIQESPFSAEGELGFNYTEADIDEAIRLLDDAMFIDSNSDGYRENPDGTNLLVELEYFSMVQPMQNVCLEAVEVFESIGINATILFNSAGFGFLDNGYFIRPHGNFDIAYLQYDFEVLEVDWLAYEYWSEYAYEPFINKPNFRNGTFDSYRDALLHSINYTEVRNAAIEMQKIIAYECPMIVSYELYDVYAYRTDRFENFLNELTIGPGGWYSLCQLHLVGSLGGPYGGTFRIGTSKEVQSFNLLNSNEIESGDFLSFLYDSLLKRYPDGTIRQLLSTQWTVETNSINEDISEGFTRIRFEIDSSAGWTDGTFCSAEDVVFSINYYRELEGHWLQERLGSLSAAYVQGNDAVFEFSSESFWH